MTAHLLLGKELAAEIQAALRREIADLTEAGRSPRLAVVSVGRTQAAAVYGRQLRTLCPKLGVGHEMHDLPETTSEEDLAARLEDLNRDPKVTAILLEVPLPGHIRARRMQARIDPRKDAECVHPTNTGRLISGDYATAPPTALAAFTLLQRTGLDLHGKEAVVVSHSEIVGKPLALLLLQSSRHAPTVTVCHVATRDLAEHTRRAEILIVAAGRPHVVGGDMIRPGAVVIDVGFHRIPETDPDGNPRRDEKGAPILATTGDVRFEEAQAHAAWITPVPGGVGPLTVTMLLRNAIRCTQDDS